MWDLIWGIVRYFGVGAVMVTLWHISLMEARTSDAYEHGFTVGQVYADPTKKTRRANV